MQGLLEIDARNKSAALKAAWHSIEFTPVLLDDEIFINREIDPSFCLPKH